MQVVTPAVGDAGVGEGHLHRAVPEQRGVVAITSGTADLPGVLDRVWTPGFAYDLTADAWRGDIDGRRPRLVHRKAGSSHHYWRISLLMV